MRKLWIVGAAAAAAVLLAAQPAAAASGDAAQIRSATTSTNGTNWD